MPDLARRAGSLAPWLAYLCSAGCTLIADLDRFEVVEDGGSANPPRDSGADAGPDAEADAGMDAAADAGDQGDDAGVEDAGIDASVDPGLGCPNPRTLCVRLTRFTPHVQQLVVVDLVSSDDNLRARAVLDPLNGVEPTADIVMPLAIPTDEVPAEGETHPLHLEIWADNDDDGVYTPNSDHDWDIPLPASGNRVFEHSSAFRDLVPRPRSIGGDFTMLFTGMTIHDGERFELMVIEDESGRTVGLYRLGSIPASGEFTVSIPDIIDVGAGGGIGYRVEFYADHNGDLSYDDPTADHAWVLLLESQADGLTHTFDHNTAFTPLDYQFDFEE